jgi:threonine/homoserine/homoserine lactone efflux protein
MSFVKAILFGMALGFSIGPMAFLIIQRSITKGRSSAIATALGISLADFTFGILAFGVGASILPVIQSHTKALTIFSGVVLIGFATWMFLSALKLYRSHERIQPPKTTGRDLLSAYVLTMHNPLTIALFLGFVGQITDIHSIPDVLTLSLCLGFGSVIGQITIALGAATCRRLFERPRSVFIFNVISAACIAAFGVWSFLRLL